MRKLFRSVVAIGPIAFLVSTIYTHQPLHGADPAANRAAATAASSSTASGTKAPASREEHAWQELAKPTKFEFVETPLNEVMEFLSEQHGLTILFDERTLKDSGVGSDTPVANANYEGISLDSALRLILRPLKITYVVTRDGIIHITTQEAGNAMLTTSIYSVQDLIATTDDLGEKVLAYDKLIDTIQSAIQPPGWDSKGGQGAIKGLQGTLAVNQTQEIHDKISTLLAALREAKRLQQKSPGGPPVLASGTNEQQSACRKLRALLEKPTRAEFIETPLKDVMNFVSETNRIPIIFDEAALKEAGLGSDSPVPNVNLKDLPARAVLRSILASLKLTYVLQNEVVVVTTKEASNLMMETRVYPVGDLTAWTTPLADDLASADLVGTITTAVAPQTWAPVGGPGTMRYYPPAQALVISNTQEVQEQIEQIIKQLRADHREHPPAPPPAAVQFEDKPLTRTFALKTTTLSAAEIVNLVQKAEAKSWTAEGAFIQPLERVEIIKTAGRADQRIVRGSLIARQKPAALRELRRLLREMDVWPKSLSDPGNSPISFEKPESESSTKVAALSDAMPAPAKCEGHDGDCPAPAKKAGVP